MIAKVIPEDVFDYVVGYTPYDPLELCMTAGQRQVFELENSAVTHLGTREQYPQSKDYHKYKQEVEKLKAIYQQTPNMMWNEVYQIAEEIAEIAPKQVNLEYPENSCGFKAKR